MVSPLGSNEEDLKKVFQKTMDINKAEATNRITLLELDLKALKKTVDDQFDRNKALEKEESRKAGEELKQVIGTDVKNQ